MTQASVSGRFVRLCMIIITLFNSLARCLLEMWLMDRASHSLSALTSCLSRDHFTAAVSPHRFRRGKRSNYGEKVDGEVRCVALEIPSGIPTSTGAKWKPHVRN